MRILPRLVEERGSEDETFTLMNAFLTALGGNFVFSAWPELAEREARRDLAAILRGESGSSVPPAVARRVEALQRLDLAFRESKASEKATECGWDLRQMVEDRVAKQDNLAYLRGHLGAALSIEDQVLGTPEALSARSGWYRLLDAYLERRGWTAEHGQVRALRRTVDLQYNRIVAKSLSAATSREDEDDRDLWDVFDDPSFSRRRREASLLLGSEARENWFSWSDLNDRLGPSRYRLDAESAAIREARINELLQDGYLAQIDQSRFMFFVRRATKGLAAVSSRGTGTITGGVAGASAGHGPASAVTGALVGAFIGGVLADAVDDAALNDAVRRWSLKSHLHATQDTTTVDAQVEFDHSTDEGPGQHA